MQRVLVSIAAGVEAARIVGELRRLGGTATGPTPELPGVIVAEVPEVDVDDFLDRAAGIPGVTVAERDALRTTEPDDPAEPAPDDNDTPDEPDVWRFTQGDADEV